MKYLYYFLWFVWVAWLISIAGVRVVLAGFCLGIILSYLIDLLRYLFDRFSDQEGSGAKI